ncbi:PD-(D/E)XK nuclease family protein [Segatella copri]|uniref:PD-(D/E)XK nuclease family protein n=1 Tax=Segatella copri TaxID=165179 RepID=A0AAW5UK15_9BACT|nr:PD-(D/E)XK nuclease family protein [Segatella copri]MCW4138913.1 PD-(D/E)XK nuclease family protein [Segatella copri]MCW4144777.1 PD-(D/E)XK nuclease family protein [Segatella copri]MCW4169264.1 PD-(D/E)XK nuclease family protein [Segatella copri]
MNNNVEKLLNEIGKLVVAQNERTKERYSHGELFNVFNILGLESKEVRLHSALLAELLRPNGMSGVGNAFQKAFLAILGLPENYIVDGRVSVELSIGTTTDTEGGRIDIIMEDGNHAIIIENKIYAQDQPAQLLRYTNFARDNYPHGYRLLYLTLDGKEACDDSAQGCPYQCISYKNEISKWLEECARISFDRPLVRETIRQYINLIKQLTNQSMGTLEDNKLVELVASPEHVAEYVMIINNQTPIENRIRLGFVAEIEKMASDMGYEIVPVGDKRTYLYEGWGGYALFKLPQNESIYFYIGGDNAQKRGHAYGLIALKGTQTPDSIKDEIGWTDDCSSICYTNCFPDDYSFVAAKWMWGPNEKKWWLWYSETLSAMVPHQNQSSLLADFLKSKMLEAKNIILKLGK